MKVTCRLLGGRDNAMSLASSLGSADLQPLTSQDNALCISLWIVRINSQVSTRPAVDSRRCGNVDNRGGARPARSRAFAAAFGGFGLLTLSDQRRADLAHRAVRSGDRSGPPAQQAVHNG